METQYIDDIKIEDVVDSNYYSFYPTRQHEAEDSKWFGPGIEIRLLIEQRRTFRDNYQRYLMWGK